MRKRILFNFAMLAVFVVTTSAQMARRSPVIVKTAGTATPQTSNVIKPAPAPSDLTAAAKAELLKGIGLQGPGSLYVKLTPLNNYSGSKGALTFYLADIVNGGLGWAVFFGASNDQGKSVEVSVKSEGAGRRYLIDCSVAASMDPKERGPFKIWEGKKLLQTVEGDQEHLVLLLETTNSGWYTFDIRGGPVWSFYSCEVTRL